MKDKALASASYRHPVIKWLCGFLIVAAIVMPFIAIMIALEDLARMPDYEGDLFGYILEMEDGILFLAFAVFTLIFALVMLKISRMSIHVYDSHILCKWNYAKAARYEYNQIAHVKIDKPSGGAGHGLLVSAASALILSQIKALYIETNETVKRPKKIEYVIGGKRSQLSMEKAQQIRDIILEQITIA